MDSSHSGKSRSSFVFTVREEERSTFCFSPFLSVLIRVLQRWFMCEVLWVIDLFFHGRPTIWVAPLSIFFLFGWSRALRAHAFDFGELFSWWGFFALLCSWSACWISQRKGGGETIEHLDSNDPVWEFLTTPCARGQKTSCTRVSSNILLQAFWVPTTHNA